jgi:subtilisin family serine protease
MPSVHRRVHLALIVFLAFGLVVSLAAPSGDAIAASWLPSDDLIVSLRPGAHPHDMNDAIDHVASLAGKHLDTHQSLSSSEPVAVFRYANRTAAASALGTLQRDPDILSVEPSVTRYLQWEPDDEDYGDQSWWLDQVRAPEAWNITTGGVDAQGTPVIVAVIDSGVSPTQPDLVNRLVPGYNAVDGSDDTSDVNGHGTHVAGVIAAQGNNEIGTAGVAMDVRIMPIRVVHDTDKIDVADEIEAIYWAVDNGANVINLSFGSSEYVQAERSAIQYAYERGVIVIAAGGNKVGRISYPGNYDETISVGALNRAGNPASFTSRVTRIDIAAPGESIYSPGWDKFFGDYFGDIFYSDNTPVSGTSFSAAIVSGAAALLKTVDPSLGVVDVRTLLKSTALDSGDPGPQSGAGAGEVDIEAALRTVVYGAMESNWTRTDSIVADGQTNRTWLWGAGAETWQYEPYTEAQHGTRLVYYYDKSRMEVTDPMDARSDQWYVTNGLLVKELISGEMQVGDNTFEQRQPAAVNVAGDPDDTQGPTYASFENLLASPAIMAGETVLLTVDHNGKVSADPYYAQYGVTGAEFVPETGHRIASVFWDYLNTTGVISTPDGLQTGRLFDPWFYATGYPITEAYWAKVKLKGEFTDVLVQCFERRCLTYTPSNAVGWKVEMGNVGQHYYMWRYGTPLVASANETRHPARTSDTTLSSDTLRRLVRVFD